MARRSSDDILRDVGKIFPMLFPALSVSDDFDTLKREIRTWMKRLPADIEGAAGADLADQPSQPERNAP